MKKRVLERKKHRSMKECWKPTPTWMGGESSKNQGLMPSVPSVIKFIVLFSFVLFCSTCGSSIPDTPRGQEEDIFPHPSNWASPETHGDYVLTQEDPSTCGEGICHGSDLQGGGSKISCFSCHSFYPHAQGWWMAQNHGDPIIDGGDPFICATVCHGLDFKGGGSKVSCSNCHSSYPHPREWVTPSSHGAFDKINCATLCHGSDFQGGDTGVSCYSCHSLYPHPTGELWLTRGEGPFHGNLVNIEGSPSICAQCHGGDYLGKNTGVSCFSCHSLYPHPPQWASSTHGNYVNDNGDSSCTGCHEDMRASFSLNPASFPRCQYCH